MNDLKGMIIIIIGFSLNVYLKPVSVSRHSIKRPLVSVMYIKYKDLQRGIVIMG